MNMRLHRQKGAALVEMAFVLTMFLTLIFAIFDFSFAIFRSAQLADATGVGARYAIVNNPVAEIELLACTSGGLVAGKEDDCDSESCSGLIDAMANIAPAIKEQEGEDGFTVTVEYVCPDSGYIERSDVYLVTVTVSGAKYDSFTLGLLNISVPISLQDFKTTRLSEDLHTATE